MKKIWALGVTIGGLSTMFHNLNIRGAVSDPIVTNIGRSIPAMTAAANIPKSFALGMWIGYPATSTPVLDVRARMFTMVFPTSATVGMTMKSTLLRKHLATIICLGGDKLL